MIPYTKQRIWCVAVGKRIYKSGLSKKKATKIKRDLEECVQNVASYRMVGL